MKKYVYMFSEGNEMMRDLLGGKGANLAAMVNLGLPVPQGFTVLQKHVMNIMLMEKSSMMK